jgi:hypothetical protein
VTIDYKLELGYGKTEGEGLYIYRATKTFYAVTAIIAGIVICIMGSCTGLCTNFGIGKISNFRINAKVNEFEETRYSMV